MTTQTKAKAGRAPSPARVKNMTTIVAIGTPPLRLVKLDHGSRLRGLVPMVTDRQMRLAIDTRIRFLVNAKGEPTAIEFVVPGPRGNPVRHVLDYRNARRLKKTILLAAASKGSGGVCRNAPEEMLVRAIRAAIIANEDAVPGLPAAVVNDRPNPKWRRWRLKTVAAAATRIAAAWVNELLHWSVERDPKRHGGYSTATAYRPVLRGRVAAWTMGADEKSKQRQQLLARRPVMALMPSQIDKAATDKWKDTVARLGLVDADENIMAEGASAIAYLMHLGDSDIRIAALRAVAPEAIIKDLMASAPAQRLFFTATTSTWRTTRDVGAVERIGTWLVRELAEGHKGHTKREINYAMDVARVTPERIDRLRELFADDPARLALLRQFDPNMALEEAITVGMAIADATREERRLMEALQLEARTATAKRNAADRLKEMAKPFNVPAGMPTGTAQIDGSSWHLVLLETENMLIDEGNIQRNCLGTKAWNSRAGRTFYYSIMRKLRRKEREEPGLRKKLRIRQHPELGEVICGGDVAVGLVDGGAPHIVELRGFMNGPPDPQAAAAARKQFPNE